MSFSSAENRTFRTEFTILNWHQYKLESIDGPCVQIKPDVSPESALNDWSNAYRATIISPRGTNFLYCTKLFNVLVLRWSPQNMILLFKLLIPNLFIFIRIFFCSIYSIWSVFLFKFQFYNVVSAQYSICRYFLSSSLAFHVLWTVPKCIPMYKKSFI
jgi:hypothetical protein